MRVIFTVVVIMVAPLQLLQLCYLVQLLLPPSFRGFPRQSLRFRSSFLGRLLGLPYRRRQIAQSLIVTVVVGASCGGAGRHFPPVRRYARRAAPLLMPPLRGRRGLKLVHEFLAFGFV